MLTPLDIQNKTFKKSLMGFKTKEVSAFINEILEEYERMYKENIDFKDKISMLTEQIRYFQTMEDTLKSTLIIAQKTAEEVTINARNKADIIVENAEETGKAIISGARDDVKDIKSEYEYLRKEIDIFKNRYESFLNAQLLSLRSYFETSIEDIPKSESRENEEYIEGF